MSKLTKTIDTVVREHEDGYEITPQGMIETQVEGPLADKMLARCKITEVDEGVFIVEDFYDDLIVGKSNPQHTFSIWVDDHYIWAPDGNYDPEMTAAEFITTPEFIEWLDGEVD